MLSVSAITDCCLSGRHSKNVESVCDRVSQFHEQVDRKLAPLSTEIKQWEAVEDMRKTVVDEWMARTTKSLEHAELRQKDMVCLTKPLSAMCT
jgi:glutamyl-tRNA reductase